MPPIKDIFKHIKAERYLSNYDFIDLVRGKAINTFLAAKAVATYALGEIELYSNTTTTYLSGGGIMAWTKILDIDFDVTFDTPRTIDGISNVNITVGITKQGAWMPAAAQTYIIAKIRKYSGVTETDLVSSQSSTHSVTNESGTTSQMLNIEADIPKTHFKIGDKLRLTIEQWAMRQFAGGSYYIGFGHDPKNRTGDTVIGTGNPTTLDFHVPFKIEL